MGPQALRGTCLSHSCAASLPGPLQGEKTSPGPISESGPLHTGTCHLYPRAPNTNIWPSVLPQSRKDKERLKQKHKKRPESPPSILSPPVVPTADKVLLPTPRRDDHSRGREARCEESG